MSYRIPDYQPRAASSAATVAEFDAIAYYHLRAFVGMAMDLDRSFGFLVHDVARLFGRRFNQRALLFLGLTRAQCKVLGYLARNEGINQAGLADLLEIKPMTLVRQIDRMEEDGWIERQPQPGDRRARRLVLTDKARPILARILDLSNEIRGESFAGLSKDEGKQLIELLRRVHGNLSERVLPLAATDFADLGETIERAPSGHAELSPVGGHQ
jgi:DNA-binding MarR family transcriptional regulator